MPSPTILPRMKGYERATPATILTKVVQLIEDGHNIILHGPGGVGKSFTICHLIKYYRVVLGLTPASTPVTALTGVAALVLSQQGTKARTLHSWAGIGIGEGTADTLANKIMADPRKKRAWEAAWLLVIDEISMLSMELYNKLDAIARLVRKKNVPFGGIQLILSGDFLQLPPVEKNKKEPNFIFESERWLSTKFVWLELEVPKRYTDLTWFHRLLRFRSGTHTDDDWEFLRTRNQAWLDLLEQNNEKLIVRPTVLKATRADVSAENMRELDILPGDPILFTSRYSRIIKRGGRDNLPYYIQLFQKDIHQEVSLKVGAQVMLRVNVDVDLGLVNGSRGVVISVAEGGAEVLWSNGRQTSVVPYDWVMEDDDGIYTCSQIPLILAWSITIHRVQASTLDCVVLDLSKIFAGGQGYVGLSRVRSAGDLYVSGLVDPSKVKMDSKAHKFLEELEKVEVIGEITEMVVS